MRYEKGKTYPVEAPTRALRQHYAALAKVTGCRFEFMSPDATANPEAIERAIDATAPGLPTNINTATHDDLCALEGVGPARAQRIIDNRPYHVEQDLLRVPGTKEHIWQAVLDDNEVTV